MKSAINFYYNLFPDRIIIQDDFCYFFVEENKYYFVPFNNDEKIVNIINDELKNRGVKVNDIIYNKDGKITSLVDKKTYALLRVNCLENEIVDLNEFISVPIVYEASNWADVWGQKIDYYAYQISERGLKKDVLLNSFSYYVGLGENAIQYFNFLNKEKAIIGIQHRRLYSNNFEINYYNPLNMVLDYMVRDLSEYIKFSFFDNKLNIDRVINYLEKNRFDDVSINLLYARLLFPTYYFDLYDGVVEGNAEEKELLKVVKKANDYEMFLNRFYLYFYRKNQLLRIEWLIKT